MRNVIGEELIDSISKRDFSDAPSLRPLILMPESDRNYPPHPSQRNQAAEPRSRQASSLYCQDGYEPTAREGRKKLNRHVLRAVKRLAPHEFDVYAQIFSPKAYEKKKEMQMQEKEHQDRAANPAENAGE